MIEKSTAALLRLYADKYETADFLADDPSWFMHQVAGALNQEAIAFLASSLSYGSRKQFFPKIQYLLDCSAGNVDGWIRSGDFVHDVPDTSACYYRLYTFHVVHQLLAAYQRLLNDYGSMGGYLQTEKCHTAPEAVQAMSRYFSAWDIGSVIPKDTRSACKRLCMYMRWMVRDHSPVDLGLWCKFIPKSSLIIPLDTHVLRVANELQLIRTHTSSMATALKLTEAMKTVFPTDPVKADFALFGMGVNAKRGNKSNH